METAVQRLAAHEAHNYRGRKRFIRLRPLDYPKAKTGKAVKGAKREVYP